MAETTHKLIQLFGDSTLAGFAQERIAKCLNPSSGDGQALKLYSLFLVQSSLGKLATPSTSIEDLSTLLQARADSPELGDNYFITVPRKGTISAWSSKATDIVRRCGFDWVENIDIAQVAVLPASVELTETAKLSLYDPLLQTLIDDLEQLNAWSAPALQRYLKRYTGTLGAALKEASETLSLGLSSTELDYLKEGYEALKKAPTDAELMMFAQANSEHCRHKIFNARWKLDDIEQQYSLFKMIRNTHAQHPEGVLSAYSDNAAVIAGYPANPLEINNVGDYQTVNTKAHIQIKVETHNHPTAISPYPGAATGSGGEIRDEAATGRGAQSRAGLTGFSVSELQIPDFLQPWEIGITTPVRMASALQIMLEAPIGAASFNNEFGRPALCGYFRTFTQAISPSEGSEQAWGYHKPIMLAGGLGRIRPELVNKKSFKAGTRIVVLGGPAMLIGLGGGAASSAHSGARDSDYDYASVQRGNPEMQRRCQEVINHCCAAGEKNPIIAMHDVGAGGLSNAIPELLHDAGCGGDLQLRAIPSADPALSPMEIWSNEAQERYVLAVAEDDMPQLLGVCERERCPVADVGCATEALELKLFDAEQQDYVVDMPMELLLGNLPIMQREASTSKVNEASPDRFCDEMPWSSLSIKEILERVLRLPAVASKKFLITIGDRYVGGLTTRDQMVGPWQVPVSDYAAVLDDFSGVTGAAMSIGERAPLATHDAAASARMAVVEAITNIAGAAIGEIGEIKLSANWMAACGQTDQDAALFEAVEAIGMELCPSLGIAIPVGKDSLSMQTRWEEQTTQRVQSPVSLLVSAFAPVKDSQRNITPLLHTPSATQNLALVLLEFNQNQQRLGQSALAQVFNHIDHLVPDVDDPSAVKAVFNLLQEGLQQKRIIACHDRSDGGLLVTALEMAFAGRVGVDLTIPEDIKPAAAVAWLFNEEPGLVIQLNVENLAWLQKQLDAQGYGHCLTVIGQAAEHVDIRVEHQANELLHEKLWCLEKIWAETSYRLQRLRDNPDCADQEYAAIDEWREPGLYFKTELSGISQRPITTDVQQIPVVAILREQGVNSHVEMAGAFVHAGFKAIDVHMSDLEANPSILKQCRGLVACGGFSYGDVLGAGRGWAGSILFNPELRAAFAEFFADKSRFALGVCNGCQMLSALRELIPGTDAWPDFVANLSGQFESRLSQVEVPINNSIMLSGLAGAMLPVVTAHGEGRAQFSNKAHIDRAPTCMRYAQQQGVPAKDYPTNPNGSPDGICGLSNEDGRITIIMPHPERLLRRLNFSWSPASMPDNDSAWLQMFHNAYNWCQQ